VAVELNRNGARPSVARPAAAIVFAMLLLMAAATAFGLRVSSSIEQLRDSATRASAQVAASAAVLSFLEEAEANQRGYVLTMRPGQLEPYWASRTKLMAALVRLDELAADTPWLALESGHLRLQVLTRLTELDRAILAARTSGQRAGLDMLAGDVARASMDDARGEVARIVSRANSEREMRTARLVSREHQTLFAVTMAAVIGTMLLGYAALRLLVGRVRLVRAQTDLHEQSERLQGTVDHIPEGVAVFDAADRLLLWNPRFFSTTGLPDTLATQGTEFIRFIDAASGWTPPLLAAPRPQDTPAVAETHRGRAVLEVWRSPMPDGGQMLAVSDITRRTEAEAIARQAQKMEALGQLTGGVAHDFNNLLQVVSANLDLLSARLPSAADPSWLRARLVAAQSGVERGARLTRHLLAFARRQPLAPEAIAPARLLSAMEDMLRRALGASIEVELSIGSDLWAIRADPHQLENAVLNLAINGRDAMEARPDGPKRLTVTAANATLDERDTWEHADAAAGDYVRIAVTDTGTGMTEAAIVRAVEPFYTTKAEGKGTGLGLSMVYGFARQSGGHFRIDSTLGQGTTVTLFIPRTDAAPRTVIDSTTAIPRAAGEKVLVVEDDMAVRAAAIETLRALGYRTQEAEDGGAALALFADGERPDILFTDVVMPGKPSARELAERARAMHPRLAVLFTSGYTQHGIVHDGEIDADVQLIGKPWQTEELARRLRDALERARKAHIATRPIRVLLAEDDPVIRESAAGVLAETGYTVREAATGTEALALLADGIDVLVADLGLPDMDGMDLAHRALRQQPALAVVIASGRSPEFAQHDQRLLYLTKPYSGARLREAIVAATRLSEPASG
jgi:signal transduction histidine kinase/DNA-binding response OmpR family regulator/CHASE3 domain sensor protein